MIGDGIHKADEITLSGPVGSPVFTSITLLFKRMTMGNRRDYHSLEELKQAIDGYIHYYNHERMKRKLDWQSPVQFREIALKAV